jgi:hypothetical protein
LTNRHHIDHAINHHKDLTLLWCLASAYWLCYTSLLLLARMALSHATRYVLPLDRLLFSLLGPTVKASTKCLTCLLLISLLCRASAWSPSSSISGTSCHTTNGNRDHIYRINKAYSHRYSGNTMQHKTLGIHIPPTTSASAILKQKHSSSSTCLFSQSSQNDNSSQAANRATTTTRKANYVRPSAAIERGSGFFIPGLEGSKVQWFAAGVLSILLAVNRYYYDNVMANPDEANMPMSAIGQGEEMIALIFILLVFLQATIQTLRQRQRQELLQQQQSQITTSTTASSSKSSSLQSADLFLKQWYSSTTQNDNNVWKSKVEWVTTTLLDLTPATHVMLIDASQVLYRSQLPSMPTPSQDTDSNDTTDKSASRKDATSVDTNARVCKQLMDLLSESKSGRIALPLDQEWTVDAVKALLGSSASQDAAEMESVWLQRLEGASSQGLVLCSTTQSIAQWKPRDRTWVQQLVEYIK